ncbi:hypothetical protein [uncultured Arthrobacter sp.]|uniref:hypothetical protein n=1 Tax=uncultured Arthrobacter sp. TaxID=114050 RepID=UPI0025D8FA29|nr:hypothetical protein [uncultured Arthrobacter sp.]
MKQLLKITMSGAVATTTVSPVEAAKFLDALRAAWASGRGTALTVVDSNDGAYPMYINAFAVQVVQLSDVPEADQ